MSNLNDGGRLDQALETIDESKRSAMRKMLIGAFVAPAVTTFAVNSMMVSTANAAPCTDSSASNCSNVG